MKSIDRYKGTHGWRLGSAVALVLCLGLQAVVAQSPKTIYNGTNKLPEAWVSAAWGGEEFTFDTSMAMAEHTASIRISPKNEDVQAWAGARIRLVDPAQIARAIKVTDDVWNEKSLNIYLNRSKINGQVLNSSIPLQVAIIMVKADGTTKSSSYIPIRSYIEGGSIDTDESTWQPVSIPLKKFLPKGGDALPVGIVEIQFQFASSDPVLNGINIGEISIGDSQTKPVESNPSAALKPQGSAQPKADVSRFLNFKSLSPPFLLPPNPKIDVDTHGNFTFDGKPRFIIGVEMGEWLLRTYEPTSGYPPELKWIYEQPLNYENAQRLGFDSIGFFVPPAWVAGVDPARGGVVEPNGEANVAKLIRETKLPLYLDMTCATWMQGALATSKVVPPEALNSVGAVGNSNNHWVPYAILTPAGRELNFKMFADTARQVVAAGGTALYYELFNEPAYDDPSRFNRDAFVAHLTKKYTDIAALNKAWRTNYTSFTEIGNFKSRVDHPALLVEWCKFMEQSFTALCKEGDALIKTIDKSSPDCTVQIMGADYYRILPKSNINMYELSKLSRVVSLNTGGGLEGPNAGGLSAAPAHTIDTPYVSPRFEGMVGRHFYLSIAEGKALMDGEFYFGVHSASDGYWLELVRGGSAAYTFHWTKRGWDPDWKADGGGAAGGKKQAELYPYNVLNPYGTPTDMLAGIAPAKQEILSLDDLFVPRQNRAKTSTALLLSFPSERYSQAVGTLAHNYIRNCGVALDFSHFHYDMVLEEQLPEGRLDRYKVLVAPGVANVYDGTPKHLQSWMEKGGTLILVLEAMQQDELGNPQEESSFLNLKLGATVESNGVALTGKFPRLSSIPGTMSARTYRKLTSYAGWEVLASAGSEPALLTRSIGKGRVYLVNAKMNDYALAGLLGGLLEQYGVNPACQLLRVDNGESEVNVESRKFVSADMTGYFLFNWDAYPKCVRLKSPELSAASVSLIDPLNKETIEIKDGAGTLWLAPNTKRILVIGKTAALAKRFGNLPLVTESDAVKKVEVLSQSAKAQAKANTNDYKPDGSKILSIDLREVVNRGFADSVAGDGKGGWTDEGENSMHGEEWGRQTYRGVPFEIIRYDMNGGNAVISLASKKNHGVPDRVNGIRVGERGGEKVRRLYFLHGVGWETAGGNAMSYVLHHTDGSTTTIPIRCGVEVSDWWITARQKDLSDKTKVAWRNAESRGFWAYEWVNPTPEKPVTSIDVVSANENPIPVIVAITAELY